MTVFSNIGAKNAFVIEQDPTTGRRGAPRAMIPLGHRVARQLRRPPPALKRPTLESGGRRFATTGASARIHSHLASETVRELETTSARCAGRSAFVRLAPGHRGRFRLIVFTF